jgi:hypothetical protein
MRDDDVHALPTTIVAVETQTQSLQLTIDGFATTTDPHDPPRLEGTRAIVCETPVRIDTGVDAVVPGHRVDTAARHPEEPQLPTYRCRSGPHTKSLMFRYW